jgi:signal peptidase II
VDAVRRRGAALLLGAAAAVYLLDRATKAWAERRLPGRPIDVVPGVLTLRFTTNSGGAFSLGQRAPWIFVAATVIVSVLVVATAFRPRRPLPSVALGLVLGGALGNLTDRVVRGPRLSGRVVDFVDLHVWPVFNVADSAIVIGAILLAASSFGNDRARRGIGTDRRDGFAVEQHDPRDDPEEPAGAD